MSVLQAIPDGGIARRPLLRPRLLRLPITRAQPSGALSTELGADGVWGERVANLARFSRAGRLVVEPSRVNSVPNPRAEGAVAGAPGTVPTGWGSNSSNRTINGVANYAGLSLLDLSYYIAATGTRALTFSTSVIAAAPDEVWTASAFVALVSGAVTARIDLEFRNSSGAMLGSAFASVTATTVDNIARRLTATGTAPANTARVTAQIVITAVTTNVVRVAYGATQIERGAFATSPILPVIGAPAAATRGVDLVAQTLTALGVPANGACTLMVNLMVPQAAPASAGQTIFQVDDGTIDNRFFARNNAGGSSVVLGRTLAGSTIESSEVGTLTPGAFFRLGVVLGGMGGARLSMNGSAVVSVTGGPTSGLTTMLIGEDRTGQTLAGEIAAIDLLPPVPDGVLRALSAGSL